MLGCCRCHKETPTMARRKQCEKCPWRVDVDPNDIPNGYSRELHAALEDTIATLGVLDTPGGLRMMACHDTPEGREQACVGWMMNQLGPGNNIPLRVHVIHNRDLADVETVGDQHATFEDTLPQR